jgi:holo-ACP synthase
VKPGAPLGDPVDMPLVLRAREQRVARQQATLERFSRPLVSVTVVMPGAVKDSPLARCILESALEALDALCRSRGWSVLSREALLRNTGPEALVVINADARALKAATLELEDSYPMGRLWDLDVLDAGGASLSRKQFGLPARRCLLCERPAYECGRSRRHPPAELMKRIEEIVGVTQQKLARLRST